MSQLHVRYVLREIYRTAREIHTELGPGYKRKRYAGALAARFSGCRYGCERDVALPSIVQSPHWKPDHPLPAYFNADFTFLYRKILVRVVLYQWEIPPGVCRDLWQRIDATGVPLGLILNFGRPEFEYRRVMHHGYLRQWRTERMHRAERPHLQAREAVLF
jgi:GxxExxY protein